MEDMLKELGAVEPTTVEAPQVEAQPQEVQTPTVEAPAANVTDDVLSLNDEQPTVEQPAPATELAPTIEVDRSAILNELFGVDNADTIKSQLAELAQLKEQVNQPRYQSKFAEYVDGLVSKYGDPKSQADVFKKTIEILTTDVETLDPKAAIAFQMKQEYPSLSDEEITTLVNGKYNLSEFATEEQQKLGQVQLKLDAQKAKASIREMQENALKGAPDQKVLRQVDEEKRVLEWKQKSQEVAKGINSFEFEVDKGKKMKFDIPQADVARLAATAEEIATKSGFIPDSNSMKQVQELVKMAYVYENAGKLISNAYKKGLSQSNAEWAQKVHNPSGVKNTAGGTEFVQNQSPEDEMVDWIASLYGG